MSFEVWTVTICGWRAIVIRRESIGWDAEVWRAARELQRASARLPLPQAHTQAEETERADAQTRAAADDVVLDVESLTAWYETRPHVRDARRVAVAAQRRGLGAEEAAEIREWLSQRTQSNRSEPDAKQLSDAERDWIERRG